MPQSKQSDSEKNSFMTRNKRLSNFYIWRIL